MRTDHRVSRLVRPTLYREVVKQQILHAVKFGTLNTSPKRKRGTGLRPSLARRASISTAQMSVPTLRVRERQPTRESGKFPVLTHGATVANANDWTARRIAVVAKQLLDPIAALRSSPRRKCVESNRS